MELMNALSRFMITSLLAMSVVVPHAQALQFHGTHCARKWEIDVHTQACRAIGKKSIAEGFHAPFCYALQCVRVPSLKDRVEFRRLMRMRRNVYGGS